MVGYFNSSNRKTFTRTCLAYIREENCTEEYDQAIQQKRIPSQVRSPSPVIRKGIQRRFHNNQIYEHGNLLIAEKRNGWNVPRLPVEAQTGNSLWWARCQSEVKCIPHHPAVPLPATVPDVAGMFTATLHVENTWNNLNCQHEETGQIMNNQILEYCMGAKIKVAINWV